MAKFSDQVSAWARKSKARMSAVHKRSIELLADEMSTTIPNGGRVPFEFGNLYKSLAASTESMPKTSEGPFAGVDVGIITATLAPNQRVY